MRSVRRGGRSGCTYVHLPTGLTVSCEQTYLFVWAIKSILRKMIRREESTIDYHSVNHGQVISKE